MTCSILIPTYRRVSSLERCLIACSKQDVRPAEIIVIVRPDDEETLSLLARTKIAFLRTAFVDRPGVVAAMNAGLAMATGDIIALTDDDGEPWPDWTSRLLNHFSDNARVSGVGGRDWQYKGSPLQLDDGRETRAGEMQWWGRVIGQHHWAAPGPPRDVLVVKGVNCAYRADVLRAVGGFDERLRGTGAQVHWELSLGLAIRRAGWKVLFDPAIGVNHYPAERFDEDKRGLFNSLAQENMVFNETLAIAEHLPSIRRAVFAVWSIALGTRATPGVLQLLRLFAMGESHLWPRYEATLKGRLIGFREVGLTSRRGRVSS